MDVSVIIVTRNTCALTCAAIQSVLESHDSLAKQIIVVDNGSTDETPRVLPAQFTNVLYSYNTANLGFARACNLAAQRATGEFLLLLNSDCRLKSDSLGEAIGWMRQHSDCAVAGAQLLNADGSAQNSIANIPSLATELLNKSLLRRLFPRRFPGKEQRFMEPIEVESVIGAFMLIRRSGWQTLGGLDERYFFFFEETDFCVEARRQGWKIFHLPQVQVWHEQGRSASQAPAAARIEYWRSRYLYFRKRRGALARNVLRAGLWARLILDWLGAALLTLLTAGRSTRWRQRCGVYTALWRWHLTGCPANAGLPRE